jgi:hypothetical protein
MIPPKGPQVQLIVFVIIFVGLIVPACADSTDIRYAAELNVVPVGCRSTAMGNTGIALPFDAVSMFWNPAAAAFVHSYDVTAEYAQLYGGLSSQACAAFRAPLQDGISVGLIYEPFFSGEISRWDTLPGTYLERQIDPTLRADGSNKGVFTNNQNILSLSLAKLFELPVPRPASYSYPLPVELSAGVSFKGFWQTMNPNGKLRMGVNVNCDAGLVLRIGLDYDLSSQTVSREIYAAASLRDALGTQVTWLHSPDNYQEKVDRLQYYGISYVDKTGILAAHWTVSLAIEKSYEFSYHGGIEALFWDMLAFRAGMSDKVPTLGAGVRYKRYYLDYAFSFDDVASSPLRLSLGCWF